MKKINVELIVGFFLIGGFCAFAYISMQFGEYSFFGQSQYYTVNADFDSVSGLKKGAVVSMAGVDIGKISKIGLTEDERARVSLSLLKNIKLTEDAIASVKTQGIIGDKYIRISQGGSDDFLKEGDLLTDTESAVDLEELVSKYIFGDV
ncbi:MAG: outer membrane lipid asymmetry maintenance protein MlaD [Desulfobulbaceae bacterium]|uniref:Outer membrane lipid asymmetry maintenance protein MlaD n=1 Tax=Candidatus Desulfobia pelagia TaxID=2841692 RepID=A0A8J6TEV9_9BACT|nr:outer membrane lipid asymmetry maintenance protein MlaD [Candidatus Desulfobia pelagia]